MNVITCEFQLEAEDVKAGMKLHGRRKLSEPDPYRQFMIVGYASVAAGVVLLATQAQRGGWMAPLALIGVGLFIPIRLTLAAFEQQSAQWDASLHLLQLTRWEFSATEVRISSPLFNGTYQWGVFNARAEASTVFLLYQTPEKYHVIPKRAFADKQELLAFRQLLEEKFQRPVNGFPVIVKEGS